MMINFAFCHLIKTNFVFAFFLSFFACFQSVTTLDIIYCHLLYKETKKLICNTKPDLMEVTFNQ